MDLHAAWSAFNTRYFHGALPPIGIEWSRRLTASAGMFVSRTGPRARRDADGGNPGRRLIRLSLPLLANQPRAEILGTLAHEMIHQWQFDRLKRRPNHGPDFRRVMETMNQDGLAISVRHSLDEAVEQLARYQWRCRKCGREYRRQRRTIRPGHHQCGACLGPLHEVAARAIPRLPPVGQLPLFR